jgi:hypothetical protein
MGVLTGALSKVTSLVFSGSRRNQIVYRETIQELAMAVLAEKKRVEKDEGDGGGTHV